MVEYTPLGSLLKVKSGETISINGLSNFGLYPVYGGNGINGYTSQFNTRAQTLIIGRVGEKCGNVYKTTSQCWVSDNALIIHQKGSDNIEYMRYLLDYMDLNKIATRNAQPVISGTNLYAVEVPYISDRIWQRDIAEALTSMDTHIANLTELIEKKKAIRDGALEDLVSGRTRLEGFGGEWKTVSFNQVITPKARIGWQGLKKDEYLKNGYSILIGGTDFKNGHVSVENVSYVTRERYEMDSNIQVGFNDVLVTKDGTIGKVAIVPELSKPATLNSGVFVFRTKDMLQPVFLYRVLMSSVFRDFIALLSAGSTIKHLYQKDLKAFSFKIPIEKSEQIAIADVLTMMDDEIASLEAERDKMQQIKAGMMDDLLTGRVRLIG